MTTEVEPLVLRDYQVRSIDGVHDLMRSGKRRVILVAPTGAGKRIIATWWANTCAEKRRDLLFVTDRTLLVNQMSAELAGLELPHGLIMGDHEEQRTHRVQLATIQSLDSRYLSEDTDGLPPANLIIIDEAHKAIESYKALLSKYPHASVVMLTATPVGPKGVTLIQPGYADVLFEGVKNSELIRDGYLLPTRVFAPSEPNIKGIRLKNGEYTPGPLGRRVQEVTCFADLFNEWAPFADRQTIVFSPSIAYANGLVHPEFGDSFNARGIDAKALSSKLSRKECDSIIEEFKAGDLRVIVSVDMLREGFDCPAASCAIDLQPNAQLRTYWQKIGRVKRPFENQQYAVYIDMAGNSWKFPHPDDDPSWPIGDESTQDVLEEEYDRGKRPKLIRCPRCGAMRKPSPRCPECKYESKPSEIFRRIRMGNGKLKEIKAYDTRNKQKSEYERRCDTWKSCLFAGIHSGKTVKQCAGMYFSKMKEWPKCLPCLPPYGSAQWNMGVHQLFAVRDIMKNFSRG